MALVGVAPSYPLILLCVVRAASGWPRSAPRRRGSPTTFRIWPGARDELLLRGRQRRLRPRTRPYHASRPPLRAARGPVPRGAGPHYGRRAVPRAAADARVQTRGGRERRGDRDRRARTLGTLRAYDRGGHGPVFRVLRARCLRRLLLRARARRVPGAREHGPHADALRRSRRNPDNGSPGRQVRQAHGPWPRCWCCRL